MDFSVVIPNYNGRQLLWENLPDVIKHFLGAQIIIVDDASTDDSVDYLGKRYPNITLIEKVTNSGFATTVNLGVKAALGDFVILLNTDAVPKTNFLKKLKEQFKDPKVFAVGFLDESEEGGKTAFRGRGIGKFERGFLLHQRGEVDQTNTLWVSGGSSAFRRDVWEKLGGMDELYNPFYWEDIDLSYRALKSGYEILFARDCVVTHAHAKGSIKSHYSQRKITQISYRNQIIFVWKNITNIGYLFQHIFWIKYLLVKQLLGGETGMYFGFIAAAAKLPQILAQRRRQKKYYTKTDTEILSTFNTKP